MLLEKTNSGAAIAAGSGLAAAGSTANAGMSYSTVEPPVLPAGVAHRELISGLMHVDTGNGPDKWYSTGKDGTVRVWNGKVCVCLSAETPLCSRFYLCLYDVATSVDNCIAGLHCNCNMVVFQGG